VDSIDDRKDQCEDRKTGVAGLLERDAGDRVQLDAGARATGLAVHDVEQG